MKLFVAAVCTLLAISILCAIGTFKSIDIIDTLISKLDSVKADEGEVPSSAKAVSDNLIKEWDEDFFIISILHPHQHLDEVKEKMVSLQSYSDTDEYAEWKQAHASLKESLLHLKSLLEANIDNIM